MFSPLRFCIWEMNEKYPPHQVTRIKWDNLDKNSTLIFPPPSLPPLPFPTVTAGGLASLFVPLCSRFLSPFNMILGGTVVVLVFTVFVWAAHNKDILRRMKKHYPTTFVMAVMLASYFLISMFGGVMVFVFGITFPLLCKWPEPSFLIKNRGAVVQWKLHSLLLKCVAMSAMLSASSETADQGRVVH